MKLKVFTGEEKIAYFALREEGSSLLLVEVDHKGERIAGGSIALIRPEGLRLYSCYTGSLEVEGPSRVKIHTM